MMMDAKRMGSIVLAEDDPDDQAITLSALGKSDWKAGLTMVANGQELLDLLRKKGAFAGSSSARPALVLLDLNMPRKNGFEALREIRADDKLRDLPVVVLSTSRREEDVERSFNLGCNSFVSKPSSFDEMAALMQELVRYWFETSEIPGEAP